MKLNLALGWLAATNLLLGLLIQWYVVTRLGVGITTDSLYAGMAVPQLVLAIVGGSLVHVLVPLLANEGPEGFHRAAWSVLIVVIAAFVILSGLLYVAAPVWVRLLLPGFTAKALALTVRLTRIQLLAVVLTAAGAVLTAAHYARHRFLRADLAPVAAGILGLAVLVASLQRFGIAAAAWTNVLRAGVPVLLLFSGIGPWRHARGGLSTLRTVWSRLKPLLIGTSYYKADPLVDRYLSSMAPAGSLSLLFIGQQIWAAGSQIVSKAIVSPMLPALAVQAGQGRWSDFERTMKKRLVWIAGLTVSGFLGFAVLGERVLGLLIGHGGVTAGNIAFLWRIMLGLGGVWIGGALGQVSSSAFYAAGDTRTPTTLGIVTFTIYLPLKILAFSWYGLIGVAVATSLFYAANLGLQLIFMRRSLRKYRASVPCA